MIKSLTIRNWKAFEDKQITFSGGITFFVGQNGVGKTTLLDAICLCLTGKSPTADFQELVRDAKQPAEILLELDANGNRFSIMRKFRRDRKLTSELVLDGRSRGMGWDELTSTALDFLAVDDMFFNRLTYMSEGEVFRYLQEPSGEALNARMKEIFGIASLQTLKGFTEGIIRDVSSSIRDISSELKTIRTKKPADDSQIKAMVETLTKLKEKEKKSHEERDALTKQIREINEERKNCEGLRELLTEITEEYGPEIVRASRASIDDAVQEAIKALDSDICSEGNRVWADVDGYQRPAEVFGYIPDIVTNGHRDLLSEVETEDSYTSDHTYSQLRAFDKAANYQLEVVIPESVYHAALNLYENVWRISVDSWRTYR